MGMGSIVNGSSITRSTPTNCCSDIFSDILCDSKTLKHLFVVIIILLMSRPDSNIPDQITKPYPIVGEAEIINGFGRGSSELGIPTANIPVLEQLGLLAPGIYFGYSKVIPNPNKSTEFKQRADGEQVEFNQGKHLCGKETDVLPMVMSIGYNPFYDNDTKTAEVHIIHKFNHNFYGARVKYAVLGYVRPELNYTSKEALIEDINLDIKISLETLKREEYYNAQQLL